MAILRISPAKLGSALLDAIFGALMYIEHAEAINKGKVHTKRNQNALPITLLPFRRRLHKIEVQQPVALLLNKT
jgi:hypothetical protein